MTTITNRIKKSGSSARRATARESAPIELTPDLIRRRAYEVYLGRNGAPGDHVSDWLQAERELTGTSRDCTADLQPRGRLGTHAPTEGGTSRVRDGLLETHA